MGAKIEFLEKAIEEVQETNRFLDTKAGVLVVFESSLLAFAIFSLFDKATLEFIQAIINKVAIKYLVLLIAYFISYIIALILHIKLSLRIITPQEAPEKNVIFGDFQPKRLFFLYKLNEEKKLVPSVSEYSEQLENMDKNDVTNEYIFELLKLSYIRKLKSDRLKFTFNFLVFLIIGSVILVFWLIGIYVFL